MRSDWTRLDTLEMPFRIDGLMHGVFDDPRSCLPHEQMLSIVRAKIARMHRVAIEQVMLAANPDAAIAAALSMGPGGLHVSIPAPTGPSLAAAAKAAGREAVAIPRTTHWNIGRDAIDLVRDGGIVLVQSPNDPTGTQMHLNESVRLAQAVDLLVIDERHAHFAFRSHGSLVREFDHVLIARALPAWAGQRESPLAYLLAPPALVSPRYACSEPEPPGANALVEALAVLEAPQTLEAAISAVVRERTRLVRRLRKLNMLQPHPSTANFVLASLHRGERDDLRRALVEQKVAVHCPEQPGLEETIRISARRQDATRCLIAALVDWGRALD
jgi:histidinol-phosphate/aromatic aminotransferase/cobyric acid decarboxylase-like protein